MSIYQQYCKIDSQSIYEKKCYDLGIKWNGIMSALNSLLRDRITVTREWIETFGETRENGGKSVKFNEIVKRSETCLFDLICLRWILIPFAKESVLYPETDRWWQQHTFAFKKRTPQKKKEIQRKIKEITHLHWIQQRSTPWFPVSSQRSG